VLAEVARDRLQELARLLGWKNICGQIVNLDSKLFF
jgi:hypothetical protein